MLAQAEFLIWERVRSTLLTASVQRLPKFLCSCEFQPAFLSAYVLSRCPVVLYHLSTF